MPPVGAVPGCAHSEQEHPAGHRAGGGVNLTPASPHLGSPKCTLEKREILKNPNKLICPERSKLNIHWKSKCGTRAAGGVVTVLAGPCNTLDVPVMDTGRQPRQPCTGTRCAGGTPPGARSREQLSRARAEHGQLCWHPSSRLSHPGAGVWGLSDASPRGSTGRATTPGRTPRHRWDSVRAGLESTEAGARSRPLAGVTVCGLSLSPPVCRVRLWVWIRAAIPAPLWVQGSPGSRLLGKLVSELSADQVSELFVSGMDLGIRSRVCKEQRVMSAVKFRQLQLMI